MPHVHLSCRLVGTPFPTDTYRASEIRSLLAARHGCDHGNVAALANELAAPVLVTYEQHYRVLAAITAAFRGSVREPAGIYIRASRFPPVQCPAALLLPDVVFMDAPLAAAERAAVAADRPSLVIQDWFRRSPLEWRDNRLWLDLFGASPAKEILAGLIEDAGLLPCLDELAVTTMRPRMPLPTLAVG